MLGSWIIVGQIETGKEQGQESKTHKLNGNEKWNYWTLLTKPLETLEIVLNIENSINCKNREWNNHMEEVTKKINKVTSKWEKKNRELGKKEVRYRCFTIILGGYDISDSRLSSNVKLCQQTRQTTQDSNRQKIMLTVRHSNWNNGKSN